MVCRASLDWSYRGMRTLVMENSQIRLVSLLDKGSDIIEILYKPRDIDFMWHSPLGWRNPTRETHPNPQRHGAFLDYYGGGWQDVAPSAGGRPVEHRGADLGIHGESSMLPWDCRLETESHDEATAYMSVTGVRYPFRLEKWVTLREGENVIRFRAKLSNMSKQDLEFSWVQHPAFGEPFLEPGGRIMLAEGGRVIVEDETKNIHGRLRSGVYDWPWVEDRRGEKVDLSLIPQREIVAEETSFISNLKEGWYLLTNPRLDLGFGLAWSNNVYRYLWFWQNYNTPDYPWFGKAWNIALEPCTSYPDGLTNQIKNGTVLRLPGGQHVEATLAVFALPSPSKVQRLRPTGEADI